MEVVVGLPACDIVFFFFFFFFSSLIFLLSVMSDGTSRELKRLLGLSDTDVKDISKGKIRIIPGSSNPRLAQSIADILKIELTPVHLGKFSNGETRCEIGRSCRGLDVYIIQSTCNSDENDNNVNDNLMELHVMINALKGASARSINAVMPIYGYARQDRKDSSRAAISARLVAKHLEASGVDRVITVDLHASQIQGFFDVPCDNLYAGPLLVRQVVREQQERKEKDPNTPELVVVSPDAGGTKRAVGIARHIGVPAAIISKQRAEAGVVAEMSLAGDVRGRRALLVDDMADTCGTLIKAAETLLEHGAVAVDAMVVHGVLSGPAMERLNECAALERLIVTDTIPQTSNMKKTAKLQVFSVAPLLAEAIRRTHFDESLHTLFSGQW
mmetsp:Transcript_43235/g.109183  ORF Transcript_43235/g.109183 Transcript_43235/m.109183 type:complete len:386 (+) Transcript_43235:112-1269(+)